MPRFKLFLTLTLGLGLASGSALAKNQVAKKPTTAKTAAKKAKAPGKRVTVSGEKKKVLAELYGGFKFGLTKDEVLAILSKQLDDSYEQKVNSTTDVALQDRLRRDKRAELARVGASYVTFDGKRTGWDVSIIEDEFAHHTGESMIERWENKDGKNQRRFFFFHEGKLWKMFISLDVSILPKDKQNFETFKSVMLGKYGAGNVEPGHITWHANEFDVRAVDKLRSYATLALVIEDPRVKHDLIALREAKAEKPAETNAVIKAVVDLENKDKPDVKQNSHAVDAVLRAQGAPPKK